MKHDQITKMYDDLSMKDKAMLAFSHCVMGNAAEMARIAETVPWVTYRGLEADYRGWLQSWMIAASMWAIEYWQMNYQRLGLLACLSQALVSDDGIASIQKDALSRMDTSMLALDKALENLCRVHGMDPEVVRHFAGAEPFIPLFPELEANDQYQAELESKFSGLLMAWQH